MQIELKIRRREKGMTALMLARAAGVSEMRIYALERGRAIPRADEAARIAAALATTAADLFPLIRNAQGVRRAGGES
jgi:transcriptional regulator with XRE-family HTH domain